VAAATKEAPKPARTRKAAPVAEIVPSPVAEVAPVTPVADKPRMVPAHPRKQTSAPAPVPVVVPPAAPRKKPAAATAPAPAPAASRKIAAAARPEQLRQTSMFGEDLATPVAVDRDVKATVDAAAPRRAARKAAQSPLRQAS
jgi:hypothetical protein